MTRARRNVMIGLGTLAAVVLLVALVLYLKVRSRPGYYHTPEEVPADERAAYFEAFERALRAAEEALRKTGAFTVTLTADQINAALDRHQADPDWRKRAKLPADVRHLQMLIDPEYMIVVGLAPTDVGSVVVSAYLGVVADEEGRLRLRVQRLRAGSLDVNRRRARRFVERIESMLPSFDIGRGQRVLLTHVTLAEDEVTVRGVKERR